MRRPLQLSLMLAGSGGALCGLLQNNGWTAAIGGIALLIGGIVWIAGPTRDTHRDSGRDVGHDMGPPQDGDFTWSSGRVATGTSGAPLLFTRSSSSAISFRLPT